MTVRAAAQVQSLFMFAGRTNWDLATNRLAKALARHRASGQKLVDLSASNPTECGFSYDQKAILEAIGQPESLRYRPDPRGILSAREAVSRYYTGLGFSAPAEEMVLTTSTSEAYSFAFRLLANAGDEILVPEPSYPLFDFLADIQDVKLVPYPLFYDHGWHVDFHALEGALTPGSRAVIVVHPNNPTGHYTKAEEVSRLNEISAARGMAIIADEVFFDFSLQIEKPPSFVANHGALTFTMSGLSKIAGLPQMKLAWLVISGPETEKREALARLEVIADTYLSLNTPIQLAAPALLDQRHRFQQQLIPRVRANLRQLDSQLSKQKSSSRLGMEGGWYAVLRVPATGSDEDLAIAMLEREGVFLHPGHFYGFPGEGYLIASLMTPEEDFQEGIRRILKSV
jgi:alanine-synthesizing transaminase